MARSVARKKIILITVFALAIFLVAHDCFKTFQAFSLAERGKEKIQFAKQLVAERDFVKASAAASESSVFFDNAHASIRNVFLLRIFPGVRGELTSAEQVFGVLTITAQDVSSLAHAAEELYVPLATYEHTQFANIPSEARQAFFSSIQNYFPMFEQITRRLENSQSMLENLPDRGIVSKSNTSVKQLASEITTLHGLLGDGVPMLRLGVHLAGFGAPQTYLFLLQNNTELRPTGGFIGSYGTLTMDAGVVTAFRTDDVMSLDNSVKPATRPPSPFPLPQYLAQPHWFFRDVNWSPDFPDTAARAIQFYQEEGGREAVSGVVAVTPEPIKKILEIVGPLTVDGQHFNSENLVDMLEWQVERGFVNQGLPLAQRKEVIGHLTNLLLASITNQPIARWGDIIHVLRQALDEKQILLYSQSPEIEKLITQTDWAGQIKTVPHDYVMVVDANLGSLKTDAVVSRAATYTVRRVGPEMIAHLTLFYRNSGTFSWKTTRLNTFTRIYVPQGSALVSSKGVMKKEKSSEAGVVSIGEEFGKTVFGAFLSIEPGETRSMEFEYRLPNSLYEQVKNGTYSLLVQKQPGVISNTLTVGVAAGNIQSWQPTGFGVQKQGETLLWSFPQRQDQLFEVALNK